MADVWKEKIADVTTPLMGSATDAINKGKTMVGETWSKSSTAVGETWNKSSTAVGEALSKVAPAVDEASTKVNAIVDDASLKVNEASINGSLNLTLLSAIGGGGVAVTNALAFLGSFLFFSRTAGEIVLSVYGIAVGSFLYLLHNGIPDIKTRLETIVTEYFPFLSSPIGTGTFFIVIGFPQFVGMDFIDIVVGGYMIALGVIYLMIAKARSGMEQVAQSADEVV